MTTDDTKQATAMAYEVLRRLQQLDMACQPDFAATLQQRRAVLEFCIELLGGPYLTPAGLDHVENAIGFTELWIDVAQRAEGAAIAEPSAAYPRRTSTMSRLRSASKPKATT